MNFNHFFKKKINFYTLQIVHTFRLAIGLYLTWSDQRSSVVMLIKYGH